MVPYLDFVNNATIEMDPSEYTGDDFHSIPYGARFSVKRGVKIILDVESFDYAYFERGARGFKVALSDARDKAVINQEGYYVAPGKRSFLNDEIQLWLFSDPLITSVTLLCPQPFLNYHKKTKNKEPGNLAAGGSCYVFFDTISKNQIFFFLW